MSNYGIQGHILEVTVVGCTKLKDTEWISRQDPYVCLEYGSTKFRTRTCKDGSKNPNFQEKFVFTLIEGLRELNVVVWNSNSLSRDDLIGSGKVQMQKVLSQGFDDTSWALQGKGGRYAGEVRLIIHYPNFNTQNTNCPPSAPPIYGVSHAPQTPLYSAPPPPQPSPAYCPPPQPSPAYCPPPQPSPAYCPPPQPSPVYCPPPPSPYHPSYPPPPYAFLTPQTSSVYPPMQYPSSSFYPPQTYPPPPQPSYYPPGSYPNVYPPPPHYGYGLR